MRQQRPCKTILRTLLWDTLVGHYCGTLSLVRYTQRRTHRHSTGSLGTRHIYASVLSSPQWHGLARTHSSPMRRKTMAQRHQRTLATRFATHYLLPWHTQPRLHFHSSGSAPQRHAAFTPARVPLPSRTDTRKHTFNGRRTQPRGTAARTFGDMVSHTLHTWWLACG